MELFSSIDSALIWPLFLSLFDYGIHSYWVLVMMTEAMTIMTMFGTLKNRDWRTFSAKGQILNILGFMCHTFPVAATQLCHYSLKAATDNK